MRSKQVGIYCWGKRVHHEYLSLHPSLSPTLSPFLSLSPSLPLSLSLSPSLFLSLHHCPYKSHHLRRKEKSSTRNCWSRKRVGMSLKRDSTREVRQQFQLALSLYAEYARTTHTHTNTRIFEPISPLFLGNLPQWMVHSVQPRICKNSKCRDGKFVLHTSSLYYLGACLKLYTIPSCNIPQILRGVGVADVGRHQDMGMGYATLVSFIFHPFDEPF